MRPVAVHYFPDLDVAETKLCSGQYWCRRFSQVEAAIARTSPKAAGGGRVAKTIKDPIGIRRQQGSAGVL